MFVLCFCFEKLLEPISAGGHVQKAILSIFSFFFWFVFFSLV